MAVKELNISEIADAAASEAAVAEANRPRTVSTGNYRLRFKEVKVQIGDAEGSEPYLHFQVDAFDLDSGAHRGNLFLNATWVEKRNDKGNLSGDFRRFGQMVKALGTAPAPTAVIDAFQNADLKAYVTETMQSPEKDKYLTVGRDVRPEEVPELLASGYTITNYVQSISKLS